MTVRHWRALLIAVAVIGFALALRPAGSGPENWFEQSDKLVHAAYFGLLWWAGVKGAWGPSWRLALWLLAFGAAIELAQAFTPTRSASLADVMADATGIALSWAFTRQARQTRPGDASG